MPGGAAPLLLLLQRRLRGLGLRRGREPEEGGGAAEPREEEEEEDEDGAPPSPPPPGPGAAAALPRGRSANTTECVAVPSSEHVAEIVGRQGCKIKALRARTNTYIKTPVRGEEPVFVVTGRGEDVAAARREILAAAEHFSALRAWRGRAGPCRAVPGQSTVPVRVPYRLVGLVVGPRGATIKRIQQRTRTYIVTPGRHCEPVFEVTGSPESVRRARQEIQAHIALRTGAFPSPGPAWPGPLGGTAPGRCDGSSGSPGSASSDSFLGGARPPGLGPFGGFWLGEEPRPDSPPFEPPPAPSPTLWAPLEPAGPPPARPSPPFPEGPELRPARGPAFSSGTGSCSPSNSGSSSPPERRRGHGCPLCPDGEASALLPCGHRPCCPPCAAALCRGDTAACHTCPACPACPTCPACPACHACPACQAAATRALQGHC